MNKVKDFATESDIHINLWKIRVKTTSSGIHESDCLALLKQRINLLAFQSSLSFANSLLLLRFSYE